MNPSPRSPDPEIRSDRSDAAAFWTFALAAWDLPALRKTLLHWQDNHDIDVMFLLFSCWFPETLPTRRWKDLHDASRQWNRSVTRRIRALRRRIRRADWPQGYESILALELTSERLEAIWLSHTTGKPGAPPLRPNLEPRLARLFPDLPPAEHHDFLAGIRPLL